jgi:hypothetical protein
LKSDKNTVVSQLVSRNSNSHSITNMFREVIGSLFVNVFILCVLVCIYFIVLFVYCIIKKNIGLFRKEFGLKKDEVSHLITGVFLWK